MKKRFLSGIGFYILLFVIVLIMFGLFSYKPSIQGVKYSELIQLVKSESITEMVLEDRKATVTLNQEPQRYPDDNKRTAAIPSIELLYSDTDGHLQKMIDEGKLKLETPMPQVMPWWLSLIPTLLTVGIFVLFWFVFMKQSQGGGGRGVMAFGKSNAKMNQSGNTNVTFRDVAGADEEKAELAEIVDFLRDPSRYVQLGARIPKGVLLVGPPGTGKTLLAKAVAGEAKVPFFSISGSDFVEMFVGVGASRVRDLFEQAKKNSPSIIFIDEIDAVGRHRGAGMGGGHDEREQTLNQLLVEMDGFGANEGIIIIAATNRPDILDPALLRPGRFDRQVVVNYPDVKGREEVLKVHSRAKPLAPDVDLKVVAQGTASFSGADLENLMNEAALLAARRRKNQITMTEIEESIIKVVAGPEKKSRVTSDKERRLTAFHEAGHAIATAVLPDTDPVHEVSIIPRGRAGGYTLSLPQEDKSYVLKQDMLNNIVILMGGRVAEKLVLDDISTGASNDLQRATQTAREMVTKYGMSDVLGPMTFGSDNDEVFLGRDYGHTANYSDKVASEIDTEIRRLIEEAYTQCEGILNSHMKQLHNVAQALLLREKIDGETFAELFKETDEIDVKEFLADWDVRRSEKKEDAPEPSAQPEQAAPAQEPKQ